MKKVRAKKHLGQHFLNDLSVAKRTADIALKSNIVNWVEIGPGMGVLSQYLMATKLRLKMIDLDAESVEYMQQTYPSADIVYGDFLATDVRSWFENEFGVIGNFPYNISSQILFKILEAVDQIPIFGGMFQLEVAQRIAAVPNNKTYGILSVLIQAYYNVEVLFKIPPGAFNPPPKVNSGVIVAKRKEQEINWDVKLFADVVKTAFQQRRKTLSNALKKFNIPKEELLQNPMFKLRAENLTVDQFKELTAFVNEHKH